jgi:hypothetical protein
VPSLTVGAQYEDAAQALLDNVLFQVSYRQLGMVALHRGIDTVVAAAQWLAANGRGGTVSWQIPGRLALWSGIAVTPGVPGSPVIDVWMFGAALTQWNTVLVRRGFWQLYVGPP